MREYFEPGKHWCDTDGNLIAAHGGGIMEHDGVYYWYGEARIDFFEFPGLTCYSSTDLMNWKNEGYVLLPVDDEAHDLYKTHAIERPKVIYCEHTQKFVMWMHVENDSYTWAKSGVAVSDSPTGPFEYIRSIRPNGQEARDMTLFKDDDGTAYLIFASDRNATTSINRLTDDYLDVDGVYATAFEYRFREGPAFFKDEHGTYFCISSNTTGFSPNASEWATADSMLGPWTVKGDPALGYGAESTYHSQSTFCFRAKNGQYILMTDHWYTQELSKSWYPWYPIDIDSEGKVSIQYYEKWNFEERIKGEGYKERPEGAELHIKKCSVMERVQRGERPEAVMLPKDERNLLSGYAWLSWVDDRYEVALWIAEEGEPNAGARVADIFLDYFDVCLYGDGRVQAMTDWGYGCAGRTQRRINVQESPFITCIKHVDYQNPLSKGAYGIPEQSECMKPGLANAGAFGTVTQMDRSIDLEQMEQKIFNQSLLDISSTQIGTLYIINVSQGYEIGDCSIGSGNLAFAVALYDKLEIEGQNPNNCVRQTASPYGWRWLNTDTYFKAIMD